MSDYLKMIEPAILSECDYIAIMNDMDGLYKFYQIRKIRGSLFETVCYIDCELKDKVIEVAEMLAAFYQVKVVDRRDIPGHFLNDF